MFIKGGVRVTLAFLLFFCSAPRAFAQYSVQQVEETLRSLAAAQRSGGPELKLTSIGKTVKGRDITLAILGPLGGAAWAPTTPEPAPEAPVVPEAPEADTTVPAPDPTTETPLPATGQREPVVETSAPVAGDTQALVVSLEPTAEGGAVVPAVDHPLVMPTAPGEVVPPLSAAGIEEARRVLIIARQHGNEPAPTEGVMQFLQEMMTTEDPEKLSVLSGVQFLIIPVLNSDGAEKYQRRNARNVDLNRDWVNQSQPETQAVVRAVREWKPDLVVDLHELATSDWTESFVETMEAAAGAKVVIGDTNNTINAAVVGQLRAQSLKINARPVFNYREPRLSHRYFSVREGVPAILVESRRSGNTPLEKRTALHYQAIWAVARHMAGQETGAPPRVTEAMLERSSVESYRIAEQRRKAAATQTTQALAAQRTFQMSSRGGDASSTAKKRAELAKKAAAEKAAAKKAAAKKASAKKAAAKKTTAKKTTTKKRR